MTALFSVNGITNYLVNKKQAINERSHTIVLAVIIASVISLGSPSNAEKIRDVKRYLNQIRILMFCYSHRHNSLM